MDQHKRSGWKTVAGLLVAGLFIVGFAAVTSKTFQEHVLQADASKEKVATEAAEPPSDTVDETTSKVADETSAETEGESSDAADATASDAADEASPEPADEPPSEVAAAGAPTAAEEAAETEKEAASAKEEAAEEKSEAVGAAEETAAAGEDLCCKPGDTTAPLDLIKKVPPGGLRNPYDWKELAAENADNPDYLVKQFRLPGCNECHGGGGGGGFCPALSQGVWFWGNTDDVLFRLIALGSADLEKQGFERYQYGTVKAPMPMMGHVIKTSDHLWKIISFIRSINPPGTNPPDKVIPGKYTTPGG
jgi:mono/diheme cytochrome c family protein